MLNKSLWFVKLDSMWVELLINHQENAYSEDIVLAEKLRSTVSSQLGDNWENIFKTFVTDLFTLEEITLLTNREKISEEIFFRFVIFALKLLHYGDVDQAFLENWIASKIQSTERISE